MKRFWLAINASTHVVAPQQTLFSKKGLLLFSRSLPVFLLLITLAFSNSVSAQQTDAEKLAAYQKTVAERVEKIVATLDLPAEQHNVILKIVINQYFGLNDIHEANKTAIAAIKAQGLAKEQEEAAVKAQEEKKSGLLLQQHENFLALLKGKITDEQLEKIKDGMTYRVFPITYAAYQDMLPTLTQEQKDRIYNWLKEARELAMDAESSDKKHAVFGKYKGRINNYLSAAGYDMKKEGEEWQKRIKEREKDKTQPGS